MWILEGHGGTRNLSQSGSNEQGEEQKVKEILRPKSEIQAVFPAKNWWPPKKKGLYWNCKGFSGQNLKFKRFFRPKTSDLPKKKVFTEIARDVPTENYSSGFSDRKQVISQKKKKKKGLHSKNFTKSCVSPQETRIWTSICAPEAPSLLIFSGHSPRLGGHNFFRLGGTSTQLRGHGPGMPPRGAGSDAKAMQYYFNRVAIFSSPKRRHLFKEIY